MKPEQQRIKIAEACGWTEISERCMWGLPPNAIDDGTENCLRHFPKYESDLNAMHEAEKSLTDLHLYCKFLYLVVLDDHTNTANEPAFATARQRAEAFLRTLGLWQDDAGTKDHS